jgi:glycosyltransferase involved in cell wall biosynthesis
MPSFILPGVTICIPCYNAARTIAETIESVLAQDYPDFRVLVCDNSSKDNTAAIVAQYSDRGVQLLNNPVVKSAEDNWNFFLEHIPTEHFCLYHADDLYDRNMLSKQVEAFIANDTSAVFTLSVLINDQNQEIPARVEIETALPNEFSNRVLFDFPVLFNGILKHSNFIRTPTLFTSKETLRNVGNFQYQQFRSSSDLDLWLRMSRYKPVVIVPLQLHRYRVSINQASFHIYNNRTQPQDFYRVIDHYLKEPFAKAIVTDESLNFYQMYKGTELIICAINLISDGQTIPGRANLKLALAPKNFTFAVKKRGTLLKYAFGLFLLIGSFAGLGKSLAKWFQSMQAKRATSIEK